MHSSLAPFYYFQVKTETSRQPLIPGDGVLQQTSQIPSRVITPWESFWPSHASCCSTQKASTPESRRKEGEKAGKLGFLSVCRGGIPTSTFPEQGTDSSVLCLGDGTDPRGGH